MNLPTHIVDRAGQRFTTIPYQSLVMDLGLKPIAVAAGTYAIVFAAQRGEETLVAKMPLPEGWIFEKDVTPRRYDEGFEHVERDKTIMEKLSGIELVAQFDAYHTPTFRELSSYGTDMLFPSNNPSDHLPILIRECMGNRTMETYGMDSVEGEANKDLLYQTVQKIHARGVANLDLEHRKNIAINGGGRPKLFDFGTAVFKPEVSENGFETIKGRDLRCVDMLTGRYTP